jgi:general secretion pathway protein M
MKEAWREFWGKRAPRERTGIAIGTGVLVLILLYAYLWLPISTEREQLRARLPLLRANAAQMRVESAEAARLKGAPGARAGAGAGLQATLEQTASQQGVREALKEITSADSSHAKVSSSSIGFDAWIAWVGRLQMEHGVRLDNAQIEALPESGKVKLQAAFSGVGR